MRRLLRKVLSPLPYLVRWYLSKERIYHYKHLSIVVLPGVFHPGLFFSTHMLLEFVSKQSLKGSRVLEVGAGTGIVSLLAGGMGAEVTATEISLIALENIKLNAIKNTVTLNIFHSDLFDKIPVEKYDWIFVNPPYYPKDSKSEEDYAWNCGEHHEYFQKFFATVLPYLMEKGQVIMVLSDVCDLGTIREIAKKSGFEFTPVTERSVWLDGKNYIFSIIPFTIAD